MIDAMNAGAKAEVRGRYHHGRLREAMVEAAVGLTEEVGPEQVTVREVARRAGVSSGAPFRHFPNKTALMTAVAEEAMRRLLAEVAGSLRDARTAAPLSQYRALGVAFLRWAIRNPTHFKIISDRSLIEFEGSAALRAANAGIQAVMEDVLRRARDQGQLRDGALADFQLGGRAMVYGLARMYVDGQLPQWGVGDGQAEERVLAVLDQYLAGLAKTPPAA